MSVYRKLIIKSFFKDIYFYLKLYARNLFVLLSSCFLSILIMLFSSLSILASFLDRMILFVSKLALLIFTVIYIYTISSSLSNLKSVTFSNIFDSIASSSIDIVQNNYTWLLAVLIVFASVSIVHKFSNSAKTGLSSIKSNLFYM